MTTAPVVAVLPQHRFDEARLWAYLARSLDGFEGTATLRQFQGGQSNPTFLIETPGRAYVLRKKPPGPLLPSAHQIEREFRVQQALAGSGVPVPEALLLCEDETVLGTSFYIMAHVAGRVFHVVRLPGLPLSERAAIYDDLTRVAASLHAVDWRAAGLADFGRPENYLGRQIDRWTQQYAASRTDAIPAMDALMAWLAAHRPAVADETALVHGDLRLGNVIVHPTEPRIVALLDWELSTLGHPLADFAYACMSWHLPPDTGFSYTGFAGLDLAALGIPDEAGFVAAYARRAGRAALPDWPFFLAFAFFRSAAIAQGVYARSLQGNAADLTATRARESARLCAEVGWAIARGGPSGGQQSPPTG